MKEFIERFIIGGILLAILVFILLFLPSIFAILILLFALCIITVEFKSLLQKIKIHIPYWFFFVVAVLFFWGMKTIPGKILSVGLSTGAIISFFLMIALMRNHIPQNFFSKHLFFVLIYCFWCLFPTFALIYLAEVGGGKILLFFILLLLGVDTFAYLGGRLFGKRKIAPSISPGKTWEGSLIGLFGGILITEAVFFVFPELGISPFPNTLVFEWPIILLLTSIAAEYGDLGESKLKRIAGIKDSSRILGSHGGVLDRFDSYILSAPIFLFFLLVFDLLPSVQINFLNLIYLL